MTGVRFSQACVWAATRDFLTVRAVRRSDALGALDEVHPTESAHVTTWREHHMGRFPTVMEAASELFGRCKDGKSSCSAADGEWKMTPRLKLLR